MPLRSGSSSQASTVPVGSSSTRASVCRRNSPPITAAALNACSTNGSSGDKRRRIASRTPSGSGSGRSAARGVVQPSLRGEQLHELVHEERVAGARVVDRGHELWRDLLVCAAAQPAGPYGRELADLVAAEALQRQAGGGARQAAERDRELGARVRLGMSVGGDRQQRRVGQRPGDELERQQGRGVGPVQVVEHDDERLLLGRRRQQRRERVEEAKAGLVGVQLGGSRGFAQRLAELGQQAGDPGRARAERGTQRREVGGARERATDLHPGPVGGRAATVPAASPRPGGPARRGVLDELARERRLADSRLAGQQDEAAAPSEGALERRLELRKLAAAPHEARTTTVAQACGMHSNIPAGELRELLFGATQSGGGG